MSDFDNFDREFNKTLTAARKMAIIGTIVSVSLSVGVLAFVGWVVVKIMQHFAII